MHTDTKSVLTIAGSDSIGGAGIQADIKTIFSLGLYACSCITAVTAQNTLGVKSVQAINSDILSDQIEMVLQDITPDAIKIGMIYTKENVIAVKESLQRNNYKGFVVLDPVLVATSGDKLAKEDFLDILKKELFPICDILTPNIPETEAICGVSISSKETMIACGKDIITRYGVKNVLIKGGHGIGEDMTDILVLNNGEIKTFTAQKIDSNNTHGTGCTLSSAIASYSAQGNDIIQSVKLAKDYVYDAIWGAKDITMFKGHGSTNHFHSLQFKR
ncbi:MAG: bifunctional hydroxymethylpyrimidine kinase/phosphomethylpyrimidine kinase [Bacteroidales bacterium]|nr:bifunctional hydroxymethylpyrimidine kinase/phosphomethylpyrimidine kinase [Bacteroidales bacterium]